MIKCKNFIILGHKNRYKFKLPEEIEIPEDVIELGDAFAKSAFIFLSILGFKYTIENESELESEPEAE